MPVLRRPAAGAVGVFTLRQLASVVTSPAHFAALRAPLAAWPGLAAPGVVSGRTALRDAVAAMAASPAHHAWVADAHGTLVRTLTIRDLAAACVRSALPGRGARGGRQLTGPPAASRTCTTSSNFCRLRGS